MRLNVRFASAGAVVANDVAPACLVAGFAACRWLVGSRFGLVLRGIEGNEVRALAMAYRPGTLVGRRPPRAVPTQEARP